MTFLSCNVDSLLNKTFRLQQHQLETALSDIMHRDFDFADIYLQSVHRETWLLEEGKIKPGYSSFDEGAGIRAVLGEKTAFAWTSELSASALHQAASVIRALPRTGQESRYSLSQPQHSGMSSPLYPAVNPLSTLTEQEKIQLLSKVDTMARARDPRVRSVSAMLSATWEEIVIARHDGLVVPDIRPMVQLMIRVIAQSGDRREVGLAGGGQRNDYRSLTEEQIGRWVNQSVDQALVNLDAVDIPAGTMSVVLGSGWPGIFLHEAIGHGLEADFNRKGASAFSGRLGEKVAAADVTVVDDGHITGHRGSLTVDDEATPTGCTVLIENGILTSYLQDNLNARLMRMPTTGNGRRTSYSTLPQPRMTNTFMLPGQHTPEDIIGSVKRGLYAVAFNGGQVDIASGKYVFTATEAWMIENGKITYPVKGATLIGDGPTALSQVSMIGNDLALDEGNGMCSKNGQDIPVGVGQPTIRLDNITVGGNA